MLPFWCGYVEKSQRRSPFPRKIIFFLLQIKIISDTVYKKQSFGSKRQCMLPFWCDQVAKRQCRFPFPRKFIFFEREIKIFPDLNKSSFRFKKVSGLLRRPKECVMHSCSIGTRPPIQSAYCPKASPLPALAWPLTRKPLLAGGRVGWAGGGGGSKFSKCL